MTAVRWRGSLEDQVSRMIYDRVFLGDDHLKDGQRSRIMGELSRSSRIRNRKRRK